MTLSWQYWTIEQRPYHGATRAQLSCSLAVASSQPFHNYPVRWYRHGHIFKSFAEVMRRLNKDRKITMISDTCRVKALPELEHGTEVWITNSSKRTPLKTNTSWSYIITTPGGTEPATFDCCSQDINTQFGQWSGINTLFWEWSSWQWKQFRWWRLT